MGQELLGGGGAGTVWDEKGGGKMGQELLGEGGRNSMG